MTPPRRRSARAAGLALGAALCACATPKQPWRPRDPEVLIEVVPRRAVLTVDGVALGPGGRPVPVPDAARVYVLRAALPGYTLAERAVPGAKLAGARVGLVLRPDGFGEGRRLDLDDGVGLAAAAALLERRGLREDAIDFAERAADAAPELPLPHRVLGDAAFALGQRKRAVLEYSAYLQLAPDAPDRRAVQRRVEELRGDITIPGVER